MKDTVNVVLRQSPAGFTMPQGVAAASETYVFEVGVPQRVPRAFALALVANNPEPWQRGGFDVYEILEDDRKEGEG